MFSERGSEAVEAALPGAWVAAPNWAEVLQKARQRGLDPYEVSAQILAFGVTVTPVDKTDAELAAQLWDRGNPLSLADRFCIAVGRRLEMPVWTCDRAWEGVDPRVVVLR